MFGGSEIAINLFHLALFGLAHLIFIGAIVYRLRLIGKGQKVANLAGIEARLRSFIFNVIFQKKLFKEPMRGIMHAFVFFGFIVYSLLHTPSQMVAGNLWSILTSQGIDPYTFFLSQYIGLETGLSALQTSLAIGGLIVLMVATFGVMNALDPSYNAESKLSPALQWIFALALLAQFGAAVALVTLSGHHFYEAFVHYFSLLVLLGLGYFAYRRWIRRASELDVPSPASVIVLSLIGTLMLATIVGAGAQLYLDAGNHATGVSKWMLAILQGMGMSDTLTATAVRNFSWWMHIGTVYAFMIYLPTSKHQHLIFAPINYFMIKDQPRGTMNAMDLENSAVYGAGNVQELPFTSLIDGLSCIECGRCTLVCPANRTGKLLNPKRIMTEVKHAMLDHAGTILSHKGDDSAEAPVIGAPYISEEELWACTTCYACVEACPVGNNQVESILEMRRNLVLVQSSMPQMIQSVFVNYENNGNPWGIARHKRGEWAEGLGIKTLAEDANVDILYWVGSSGSYDDRNRKVARAFVEILKAANVRFGILGEEEFATGDTARRTGNEYLFQTIAAENIATLQKYKVKKIVTTSPHSYNCLKNDYKQLGGDFEVFHHTEFIAMLMEEGKLDLDADRMENLGHRRVVYHDACYLGRYNNVYAQPRAILEKATGMSVTEAVDHHSKSLCCGAGGGQMWVEEEYERVNIKRTQQLIDTGADLIATACPFCMTMITDGVKASHLDEQVAVKDVAEILAAALKGSQSKVEGGFEMAGSTH